MEINDGKTALGGVKPGSVVKLGSLEFYVLGHGASTTAVLAKDCVKYVEFGGNGDWRDSGVRRFCNGEFYNELADVVGAKNIIKHTVNLTADDGTGKGMLCRDNVSILTTDLYRRYRKYLPAMGDSWWVATRVMHDEAAGYANRVCNIYSNGVLGWHGSQRSSSVRPFCILNSSILAS